MRIKRIKRIKWGFSRLIRFFRDTREKYGCYKLIVIGITACNGTPVKLNSHHRATDELRESNGTLRKPTMKTPIIFSAAMLLLFACKAPPVRPKVVPYSSEELQRELAAGRAWTFRITMDSLTPTGQIAHSTNGDPLHIVGELGLAAGDVFDGAFELAGVYEYSGADGSRRRLRNYIARGPFDIAAEVKRLTR